MHVSYGRQAIYRRQGIEPECSRCAHYGAEQPSQGERAGQRFCDHKLHFVKPTEACFAFERAAGAD